MFKKVLIANRGEIAVRITQTLQEMGIVAVAVYSEPDEQALHVLVADEAYPLGGTTAAESYLKIEKILSIAQAHGVEAIHPGYGFLSENAAFAEACAQAGITFIGPSPQVIRSMGDKIIAKETMTQAGVPVLPGWSGNLETPYAVIEKEADQVGYPLLVKAAAGGGGKGMRLVQEKSELQAALEGATREAKNAFGDGRVFLEKYIPRSRHIEFQIFGDSQGNAVHLFERECSIQRRHQKIVEETPSPALTPEIREKMGAAAVKAAQAIGYTNAGTVEFLFDDTDGSFYFLEVNTRLQVEHPVTEMVAHRDLVRAQLLVASGEPLPFTQADLIQDGHAFECRVYAEDPAQNFLPSTGTLHHYHPPVGPSIRVDSGVSIGSEVTVHYDPMLSKLVTWGKTRQDALEKMQWALHHYVVLGVRHNLELLQRLFDHPEFQAGRLHTHFLAEYPDLQTPPGEVVPPEVLLAGAWVAEKKNSRGLSSGLGDEALVGIPSPWQAGGHWRVMP